MRVPLEWLSELCDAGLPAAELGDRLTMTGTKVEAIDHHGVREHDRFVVGKVLEAVKHPDADRLRACTVDVGEGEPSSIVCGAPNVATGQTVAVARPGAVMPDGTKLKKAKLRGVVSEGMICAVDELGIGTEHDGILVLPDDLEAGTPLAEVLPLGGEVIEFEITPNRPDCLGVFGIAREVHATTGAPLAAEPWAEWAGGPVSPSPVEGVEVVVEAPDLNPRFTARAFDGVRLGPSPPWLSQRLMAAGMRPINNVVDITNYVMLLSGHPAHAFDLDRVAGGRLLVRRARDGERMTTLDDAERELDSEMLVICDDDGPTSIAGIMGGRRSEVQDDTTSVLLEVASWDGHMINRASARLGLRSEASGRFEKGLAPEQAAEALALGTRLMLELTGATLRPGTVDVRADGIPAPLTEIAYRPTEATRLLGTDIPADRQTEILEKLGFKVQKGSDPFVQVPHFRRNDVTREADLVEEVARIDGVDRLPATLPARRDTAGRLPLANRLRRRAVDALVGRGLLEVAGWSFTEPGVADRLRLPEDDPRRGFVALQNPMSEDQSVLRTTLLGSLLDVARRNHARGATDLRLFEQGAVYARPLDPLPSEHRALGALLTGRAVEPTWRDPRPPGADVFAAKGLLEAVFAALRVPLVVEAAAEAFLHPGRSARVLAGEEVVGWVGELHPLVAREWELEGAAAFEIDLDAVVARADALPAFRDLTSFPALRLDLAVVVPEDVPSADVLATVRRAGGKLLQDARVFDVFSGAQVGEGRTSLAIALTFRAPDRTLSDEDVAPVREAIVGALADRHRGELRG